MWYIHITECYSIVKMNEGLIYAITLMNLENIMIVKVRIKRLRLYEMYRISKYINREKVNQWSSTAGKGTMGSVTANGHWVFLGDGEKVLEVASDDDYTTL